MNCELVRVLGALTKGILPEGKASIAAVKPSTETTSEVVTAYEESCDALPAVVAASCDCILRCVLTTRGLKTLRDWAVKNGCTDLANVGSGSKDNYPVQSVSWYDAVKWCNAKSEKEGNTPVYQVCGAWRDKCELVHWVHVQREQRFECGRVERGKMRRPPNFDVDP